VFEGLELVELEVSRQAASTLSSGEHSPMEVAAVQPEQLQASGNRASRAAKDARRLTVSDLGREQADEVEMEMRSVEAVVESEGLDGEGSAARAASEALNEAAVAVPAEAAVATAVEGLAALGRAAWSGATKRSVAHGILLSEA
jgi:hypothetical protein